MIQGKSLKVVLVYSAAPRNVREWHLELAPGSTIAQAIGSANLLQEFPELKALPLQVGIWGKRTDVEQPLADNDRVEIYRPLKVDPKTARRERFNRQGIKRAGLFSSTRQGGKAGY